jgi:hypothetical protein
MNNDLKRAWDEAERSGEVIEIGNIVVCDYCNEDYTLRDDNGGFLFQSSAVCPQCAPRIEASAKEYRETQFIRQRAESDESFRDFVLRIRNGNNTIQVRKI